jgi:Zn ribbon nucleic-acid-binding protein
MWKLKACPRCKGDLIINRERHLRWEECLQCGYQKEAVIFKPVQLRFGGVSGTPQTI